MVQFDQRTIQLAAFGGLLLGIATSLNYVLRGKVTGMSGIVYSIISLNKQQLPQKLSIVGGMLIASALCFIRYGYGQVNKFQPFGPKQQIDIWTTKTGFILAGLLVGFGTKLANGCTSGHGLCGLPRLSLRSFVAVCVFLSTGLIVGTYGYHFNGIPKLLKFSQKNILNQSNIQENQLQILKNYNPKYNHSTVSLLCLFVGLLLPIVGSIISKFTQKKQNKLIDYVILVIVGMLFSIGLLISGMSRRVNIIRFLQIGNQWNPALLFVLGAGLIVNLIVFNVVIHLLKTSLTGKSLFNPKNSKIDWKLFFGAFCFGIGWAIAGLCPGPFIVLFAVFNFKIHVLWGGGLFVGMYIAAGLTKLLQRIAAKQKWN